MIFSIHQNKDTKIDSFYTKAMEELSIFYNMKWEYNQPPVFLIPDRNTLDKLWDMNTQEYMIGGGNKNGIYILTPEAIDKESSHTYSDDFYFKLIKHELSHAFYDVFVGKRLPLWLDEGLAVYLAQQDYDNSIEVTHCIDYFDKHSDYEHSEASVVVEKLIRHFGKDSFIAFLRAIKNIETEDEVKAAFKKVFKIGLKYEEINRLD